MSNQITISIRNGEIQDIFCSDESKITIVDWDKDIGEDYYFESDRPFSYAYSRKPPTLDKN